MRQWTRYDRDPSERNARLYGYEVIARYGRAIREISLVRDLHREIHGCHFALITAV